MGATITSNSWGGGGFSQAMSNLLDVAQQNGQIFVAAAGNSATNNDQDPHYPSSYPHDIVVAVASTTISDTLSFFSCYGANSVDLGAPGSNIWSTIPGNEYSSFSGTSMATPHVAGAFAMLYAVSLSASAPFLKQVVLSSGQPLDALDGITVSGKRLDVAAAIEALSSPPAPTTAPPAVPLTPTEMFGSSDFDLSDSVLTFTPDGTAGYTSCVTSDVTEYIVDPSGGTTILDGAIDNFHAISLGFAFPFYGNSYSTAYVGSNGYITFDQGDYTYWPTLAAHFSKKRISAMFTDFANNQDSTISWKAIGEDVVVVTWDNIRQYGTQNRQSFQAVLSSNGTVMFMYKGEVESTLNKIVGMSPGEEPDMFSEIDYSETTCPPPTPPATPAPTSVPTPAPGANITCSSGMQSTWTTDYIRFMCSTSDGDNVALLCNGMVSLHRTLAEGTAQIVAVCQGSVLYHGQAWH
uniref:Peptidase s8 n=1 Tax=Tetraselmis sp. GSL018 TaxID=582737 RepID=A0A061QVQ9_9CHLO